MLKNVSSVATPLWGMSAEGFRDHLSSDGSLLRQGTSHHERKARNDPLFIKFITEGNEKSRRTGKKWSTVG